MDGFTLRARQAPLKAADRQTPASATVWLHAEGALVVSSSGGTVFSIDPGKQSP